ncbi:MAG: tRNA (adenosine(37)-N6)-threonylcarbamoyltransferase complex dimerization subunit type 1 TsaB [Lachnospiraceae bacterium]|nr:tRNA (adenosine(37)-N6)-threonylcarbamoyltransferase complex dimerization subunit type 1 TsaB [Lachnospiraceae bacterium]
MKILAIDSSSLTATVAILEDDRLTAEYTVTNKKTHSQTLVPMLEEIRKMAGLELDKTDAIAVTSGPGSFTGLRIGSATAKGIGLALDKPIIAVPTLEVLAMNAWGTDMIVCPIMDARREQVYTGIYRFKDGRLETLTKGCAIAVTGLCAMLEETDGDKVLFLGDGVPVYRELIDKLLKKDHCYAPAHMSRQRAGSLAVLAGMYYEEESAAGISAKDGGHIESAADHRPEYLRKSQAERERSRRESLQNEEPE